MRLLVLDATKDTMNTAPQVSRDQYMSPGQFEQESKTVDAYWAAHPAAHAAN